VGLEVSTGREDKEVVVVLVWSDRFTMDTKVHYPR